MNAGYRWFTLIVKILLLVMLVIGGNLLSEWIAAQLDFELTPRTEPMVHRIIMVSAVAYTVLLAFPFVPGVEIGLALIGMFGPKILLLVYLCTLTGLSLSFMAGACIPERVLIRFVRTLRLTKTSHFLEQLENLDTEQRLQILLSQAPARFVPTLIHYRYIAVMVGFNLPGNALIGGGGGIALMAGMSRLFSFPVFLLSVAVAVSPIPLAILFLQN